MSLFEPWLGNMNPTDQAKNEYIRKLKAALIDTSGLKIEAGTYTGDGSSPRTISLADTDLQVAFIVIGDDTGTKTMTISFEGMSPTSLVLIDASPPVASTTAITTLSAGSFIVNDNTYTNANASTYYYSVFGS